jgi:sulfoxide reductase catalytic subunit YedY
MHIIRRRGWEVPESQVTPEAAVVNRRQLLGGSLALSIGGLAFARGARAQTASSEAPRIGGAGQLNPKYVAGREMTPESAATTYNNYYEFSEGKNLWRSAQSLKLRPWTVTIDGMVAKPKTLDVDDLIKQVALEERIYRHRCVERWAMTVPWTGFPMTELLRIAEPTSSAKYIVFETLADKKQMSGLRSPYYPWPYIEGVAIDEAANDVAFMSTGMFGKPLTPQNGGPLRVTLPWKYGFKSGKALVRITFTDKRPVSFWEQINPGEYGFWANVNPAVAHPRWSQADETLIGDERTVKTVIYNGYGEFVAGLYENRKSEKLFM